MSWLLTSRALTVAIVGSVVLINSVAWGIPLLVGSSQSRPALDGTDIKTGTVTRSNRPATERRRQVTKTVLQAHRELVPLPDQSPERPSMQGLRKSAVYKTGRTDQLPPSPTMLTPRSRPWQSRQPITLFPRPEPAPELERSARLAKAADGIAATVRGRAQMRKSARDIVLVSLYTPGVRIAPDGRGHEWRHRNLRTSTGPTTFDKARAIARRAARRFEQMRDRMASNDERARNRALLPVAPRPPRIVDGTIGRSASRSAYSYVRARLIRRPLDQISTPPRNISSTQAAPISASRVANAPQTAGDTLLKPAVQVSPPRRIARLAPKVTARSLRRARARPVRARIFVRRAKRRQARRRRAARLRGTHRRRSARKINGFRSGFHRQLVTANFFGSGR